jgi:hypothetical protein
VYCRRALAIGDAHFASSAPTAPGALTEAIALHLDHLGILFGTTLGPHVMRDGEDLRVCARRAAPKTARLTPPTSGNRYRYFGGQVVAGPTPVCRLRWKVNTDPRWGTARRRYLSTVA